MGNYRLTEEAKDDLRRIYRYGFEKHGEKETDKYYSALFDRFDQLAELCDVSPYGANQLL